MEKTTRSISDLTADSVFVKKKKMLCFLLYLNSKRSTNLVSVEARDCTVREKFNEKTVHTTSLSLTVNYLGIRYRLPTRRNSTQQTDRGASRGGGLWEVGEWRGESRDVTRGGGTWQGEEGSSRQKDRDFRLRSKVIWCHLKINLSRHCFPFFWRQPPELINTFITFWKAERRFWSWNDRLL